MTASNRDKEENIGYLGELGYLGLLEAVDGDTSQTNQTNFQQLHSSIKAEYRGASTFRGAY